MSFLSILLFASAFYFVWGRPDAIAAGNSAITIIPSETPEDSISTEDEKYIYYLIGFIQNMRQSIDDYILPIMSDLSEDKQDQLKNMALDSFSSYFTYIIFMLQTEHNSTSSNISSDLSLDNDDIILESESLEPLDSDSLLIPEETTDEVEADPDDDQTADSGTMEESFT